MAQEEIYNFLKENKNKKFTSREIKPHMTSCAPGTIATNLKRLIKDIDVHRKLGLDGGRKVFYYWYNNKSKPKTI